MDRHIIRSLSATLLMVILPGISAMTFSPPIPSTREEPVMGQSGMVASGHPLASTIGVEVLKRGGNAVDAAVAAAFALGVVEPHASGLGGGGYMLIHMAREKETAAIDYREQAPGKAGPELYQFPGTGEWMYLGHRSVAVPGTAAGLGLALKKYGTMPLASLLAPPIRLAEEGFPVSRELSRQMRVEWPKLIRFPEAARIFLKNGEPYLPGEKMVLRDLGGTYRKIAETGPEYIYQGEFALRLAREMEKHGGKWITGQDLKGYRALERIPLRGNFRGREVLFPPPTSGGMLVMELLNILEGLPLKRPDRDADSLRQMAEAQARIFMDRLRLGDPEFVPLPMGELLSPEHAAVIGKEIRRGTSQRPKEGTPPAPGGGRTTHLSVADRHGNMVALTQTLNTFFGSCVVVPGTGVLLNNEMDDFDRLPGRPNSFAPGKRPLSSMSPLLLFESGKPVLSIGSAGGTRILTALPEVLLYLFDFGMNIQQAINAPRAHDEERLFVESRIPPRVRKALSSMGYDLVVLHHLDIFFGGVQAVQIDRQSGTLYGATDPRRDGAAAGY